jgi:NAD(P)-dependent dehydrogenase (short-subunit alcohol dehydrogenase family)
MSMNKTAVITGAGTGIGKATAYALVKDGWNVAFIGRRKNLLEEAIAQLEEFADQCMAVSCDVADMKDVDESFDQIAEAFGRIDLLFNNAGLGLKPKTIDEYSFEDWNDLINVNLSGSFYCARAAFRHMRHQDPQGGRIINNGSISAHTPRPGSAAYTTAKHGITGLTKTIALDGRPFDIACGQIDIGNALTEIAMPMTQGTMQAHGEIAVEPTIDPERVADAILHMASLPLDANILNMTIMATKMPFVGRG